MTTEYAADLVVVGDGIAGCATAIAAYELGGKVVVVDKAPADVPHGNTAFSGGSYRHFSDTYPADRFFDDIVRLSGQRADQELLRIVVDNSVSALDWLKGLGIPWIVTERNRGRAHQATDRGLGLAAAVRKALAERPIDVLHEAEAYKLLQDDGKAVVGLLARDKNGEDIRITAGAVVLATGGFQANREMVVRYLGEGATNLVLRGSPFNTGDGHRMAEEVGAQLDWMDDFHGGLIHYGYGQYPEVGAEKGMRSIKKYERSIFVNKNGERYVDEGEDTSDKTYAKFGKITALTQPDGYAFAIFDSNSGDEIDPMYDGPERGPIEASSIEALAEKIGIDPVKLRATVDEFNAGVEDGKCLTVTPAKTGFACEIKTPPFYAYKVTGGFTFTFGGVRVTRDGEVLDSRKRPIPGLYAVGEIQTGIYYGNYAGGSSLPRCAVFGRIVGREALEYARRIDA